MNRDADILIEKDDSNETSKQYMAEAPNHRKKSSVHTYKQIELLSPGFKAF